MANVDQIWQALILQISTAMQGTNPLLPLLNSAAYPNGSVPYPQPEVCIDWPPLRSLQQIATGGLPTVISVFDRGAEKNSTNAIPILYALPPVTTAPGSIITPSATYVAPGQTVTLTGSGTPILNDAFCLTLISGTDGQTQIFANYTALSTDTLSSAMIGYTAQINLLPNITAVLAGPIITVTNNADTPYTVRAEVVNVNYGTQEGFRWLRDVQITVWSRTPSDRSKYGNILEQLLSQLEVNYGFFAADQTACRLIYKDDLVHKDTQLEDIYRRDFLVQINYAVLNVIPLYPIETIPQTYDSPIPEL